MTAAVHPRPPASEVPLPSRLAEFRAALREEMEAAKRNAAVTAVPLRGGRRVAQVGSRFHYLFAMESALNLAGDTPGTLWRPDAAPVDVEVIDIQGIMINLSSPVDLGTSIPGARLRTDLSQLLRHLIQRIESLSLTTNKAGDRILQGGPVSGTPISVKTNLNPEQQLAVESAVGRDTTFIWGPPGTGKTHTIGVIGSELYKRQRSVIVVSHTNTAVDGALLRIANTLGADLKDGTVLRVGDPVDIRLRHREELHLETHVRKRKRELGERLELLELTYKEKAKRVLEAQHLLDLSEWVLEAGSDIDQMARELAETQGLRAVEASWKLKFAELSEREPIWTGAAKMALSCQSHMVQAQELSNQLAAIKGEVLRLDTQLLNATQALLEAEDLLVQSQRLEPLRRRTRELGDSSLQNELWRHVDGTLPSAQARLTAELEQLAKEEQVYARAVASGRISRVWNKLPDPAQQLQLIDSIRKRITKIDAEIAGIQEHREDVSARLKELDALEQQLAQSVSVPSIEEQAERVRLLRNAVLQLQEVMTGPEAERTRLEQELGHYTKLITWFRDNYHRPPEEVLRHAEEQGVALDEASAKSAQLQQEYAERFSRIRDALRQRLEALRQLGLTSVFSPPSAEGMLEAVQEAFQRAATQCEGIEREAVATEIDYLNEKIRDIESEILRIRGDLERVEELVIGDAVVVATTLARAYLRDSIQVRSFDTVILDEASMAPIPALWVAAALSQASVVVVGDFKQLQPIVLSTHVLAKKWLGRDIFEVAGVTDGVESGRDPECLIQLRKQQRMHPDISGIANRLIYHDRLRDADGMHYADEDSLSSWYRKDWGHDAPVLVVDTGSLSAWVTSVPRGKGASRLNLLSSGVCAEIASHLLRDDRPSLSEGSAPRVLICSPYRPHAKLTELFVEEQNLGGYVLSGTAHTFQGKEAEVVILDLVNDDPHWRVGLFNPENDEAVKRLINVAVTRAKRRLIVVGDVDYIRAQARKAFLGHRFLPLLEDRFERVDAVSLLGGFNQGARQQGRLVAASDFLAKLSKDLEMAEERAVIYSPRLDASAFADLGPALNSVRERLVKIYVITRHPSEEKRAHHGKAVNLLQDLGLRVIYKRGMREKLVAIDGRIVLLCSQSPLEPRLEHGIVVRWEQARSVNEILSSLRTNDLVRAFEEDELDCPVCGNEIVAAEGKDAPYYWRCIEEGCYTRNIDQPFLRGGIVVCARCSGEVEFREWGGEPRWGCVLNRQHRQRIAKSHLRIPEMRALIPRRELRKLDRQFGLVGGQ